MKNVILLLYSLLVVSSGWSQNQEIEINGMVSDGLQPLIGVNIKIDNSDIGTKTDSDGKYLIMARDGDMLVFTHLGYEPIEIITEDVSRVLNLIMVPAVEILDDVTVTKRVRKTQKDLFLEYNTNPKLIKTQFGILDKETYGNAIYILEEKAINPSAINILAAIQGKFPGIQISPRGRPLLRTTPFDPDAVVYIRGGRGGPAIYEVDGLIYRDPPIFLDVQNITRIALLSSLAEIGKYGGIGTGGIIIINTKVGNFSPDGGAEGSQDIALVRNNHFQNDALDYDQMSHSVPTYLEELRASQSLEDAKRVYEEQLITYGSYPYFLLDAYQYFFEKEDKPKFADAIIDSNSDVLENNPMVLKALAYIYQVQNRPKKANRIYKDIFILRPNYSQSYLDLASSYSETGQFKQAAGIYTRYQYLLAEGFMQPEAEFDAIFEREYNNFLKLHGKELFDNRTRKKITANNEYYNTRLVFEWNDSEAEFELQFVSPDGKYSKSENSLFADAERIRSQKIAGYAIEEHLIDDSMLGDWQVNVRYLGNKSLTPSYFKATIYSNYGNVAERKQIKLFELRTTHINQKLFTISNSASVTSN